MPSGKSKHKKSSKKYQYDAMFPVHIEAPLPQPTSIWPTLPPRVKRSNSRNLSRSLVLNVCVAGVVLTACLHIQIGIVRSHVDSPTPEVPPSRTSFVVLGGEDFSASVSDQQSSPQSPIHHSYLRGSSSTKFPDELSIRDSKSSKSSQSSTTNIEFRTTNVELGTSSFPSVNKTDVESNGQAPSIRLR